MAAAVAVAAWSGPPARYDGELEPAVEKALAAEAGLIADTSAFHWIDDVGHPRRCLAGGSRAVLLARRATNEPRDVYLVRIESSPEGAFLRLCGAHDLTNTSLADEAALSGHGSQIAWRLAGQGSTYRVELSDLDAGLPPEVAAWDALARWQWHIAQLQQTGQLSPIVRRSFRLEPAAAQLTLKWQENGLEIRADGHIARIETSSPRSASAEEGHDVTAPPLLEESRVVAHPGSLLTWAVDRARALPWLGNERVQWLKAVAFAADARLERALGTARAADLDEDLPPAVATEQAPPRASVLAPTSALATSGLGSFPPPPLVPYWSPPIAGEGEWRSLDGDLFVKAHPGLPPPFATTFVRPDSRLETARVVIVMWDPRRFDLHFVGGTEEPESATGELGTGLIPRSPALMSRLAAAFNGGFQTIHGAFGAQVDGKLIVPPRPYAATVAHFDDGAIGFGTWPPEAEIPPGVDSFRQNLTPLVSAGVLNPYERQWWGGVPVGWTDVTRTVRSALCLTDGGLIGYFYGSRADHEALGAALLMARCAYGIHLDMNAGHTGFEFYTAAPSSERPALPPAELEPQWKVEAPVPGMPDWQFRSRRLFKNMQLMHFPRYIERQTRDFFYLTERALLPTLPPAPRDSAQAGSWERLVAHESGFPQLLASARVRPDRQRPGAEVRLLELDLKWLSPTLGAAGPAPPDSVLSVALPAESGTERVLWVGAHTAHVGAAGIGGHVIAREASAGGAAGWGLIDHQILIYAEVVTGRDETRDAALLDRVLVEAGASERLITSAPNFIAIEGRTDLRGQSVDLRARASHGEAALHFQPRAWQALRPFFTDTKIVDPETWQPRQP